VHAGALALHRRARELVAPVARRPAARSRRAHRVEKRRKPFRQRAAAALTGVFALGAAAACELPPRQRLESGRVALSYRTTPAKIAAGQPFEVYFGFCPNLRGPMKVDAHMPEHRHGMNYRPSVAALAGGYRSEGWLFHMPGRWELVFEVGGERLTDSIQIE